MVSDAIMTKDVGIQHLIRAVDEADSANGLLNAVKALAAENSPAAIPSLIQVLRYNNPGAAVAAVDGLIAIGEPAVQPILAQLDSYNYGARAWAVRALAGIGDPRGIDLLISAAETDFALSVRRAAASGLGNLHWDGLSSEQVQTDQERVYCTLIKVCQDPEWVVRYAGIVGLQGLASAVPVDRPAWFSQLLAQLQQIAQADAELVVRARAVLATQTLSA